ncbi:MAG TPA: septum site-determining protein MinD [Hadesarchaea archaeon]|nr:septum site-determining protein MinD [Hadesarchaea archaeon]
MRLIALASGKGGVGRTTMAANLGIALSGLGKSTIIVDASLTTPDLALLFKLEKSVYTINDALAGEISFSEVLYTGPKGVRIAPAAVSLDQIRGAHPEYLAGLLRTVPEETDFIIIDAPSGLRRETIAALRAAREVLLVTVPDMVSVSDCMKTRLIAEFLGLSPIGMALNRVRKEEFEIDSKEIETILNVSVLAEIPEDEGVNRALNRGVPLMVTEPKSPAAKAIRDLARKLIKTKSKEPKT